MRYKLFIIFAVLLLAAPIQAQVYNGDFEIAAGAGWAVTQPTTGWFGFEAAGGNPDGYATVRIAATGPVDVGCMSQTFDCGTDNGESCVITFDYSLLAEVFVDGGATIRVYIDGATAWESSSADQPWTTAQFAVPCGTHEISFCLELSTLDEQYVASFDNVTGVCEDSVPTEGSNWSTIKSVY